MEMANTTHFCRLCLGLHSVYLSLYERQIKEMLESLSSMKVRNVAKNSTFVCPTCFSDLKNAYQFQQKVIKTEKALNANTSSNREQLIERVGAVYELKTEIKLEESELLPMDELNNTEVKLEDDVTELCTEPQFTEVKLEDCVTELCPEPQLQDIAENTVSALLPDKSRHHYEKQFSKFEKWCSENKIQDMSENVLLTYFELQRKKYKPSTLWAAYSMLRSCLNLYKGVDISKYNKLQAFLKGSSEGYNPKKSKILDEEDIDKFIREADDKMYLAKKIVLIMGYSGACRREELVNMSVDDIQYKSDSIIVSIPKTKNNIPRTFAVTDKQWIDLIKTYVNLRPDKVTHKRFFLTYRNGYCINSPIGINIMGKVSKDIADFLKLPNPELFTGHCFRRSSLTHLAKRGGNVLTIKHKKYLTTCKINDTDVNTSFHNEEYQCCPPFFS